MPTKLAKEIELVLKVCAEIQRAYFHPEAYLCVNQFSGIGFERMKNQRMIFERKIE